MGLNKHELATIVETHPNNFSIEIRPSEDGFWYVIVTFTQPGIEYEILTARGALKSWRNLADAVLFSPGKPGAASYLWMSLQSYIRHLHLYAPKIRVI